MESPRRPLVVPKGNKHENDREAGRSPNVETPKRPHCLSGECESDQETGRNLTVENPKRSPAAATKHFMVPTISAASKTSPAWKKVLCERNEATEIHVVKTTPRPRSRSSSRDRFGVNENSDSLVDGISVKGRSSMDSSSTPRPKFLRYNPERRKEVVLRREIEVEDCKKDDGFNPLESRYGSDNICYDPVRNYLSPRPKFLWYDPNRSREKTLRRESEAKEPCDSDNMTVSESDLGYSSSSLDSPGAMKEREEVDESDGEVKEVDESDDEVEAVDGSTKEVKQGDKNEKQKEAEKEFMDGTDYVKVNDDIAGELEWDDSVTVVCEESNGGEVDLVDEISVACEESDDGEVSEDVDEAVDGSTKEVKQGDKNEKQKEAEKEFMDGTDYVKVNDDIAGELVWDDSVTVVCEESNGGEVDLVDEISVACEESDGGEVSEDVDESDWELEEAEVKKGWRLRGVLKFLLLMFVLTFSSSVILNTSFCPPKSIGPEGNVESEGGQITMAEKDQMSLIRLLNLEVIAMSFTEPVGGPDTEKEEMHSEENEILDAVEDENLSMRLTQLSEEVKQYVEQEDSGKELAGLLEACNGESLDLGGLVHVSAELHENEDVESPQQLAQDDFVSADADVQLAGATSGSESENGIHEEAAEAVAVEETPELQAVEFQKIELSAPTYALESTNVVIEPIKEQIVDPEVVVESLGNPFDVNANPEIPRRVAEVEVLEVPFKINVDRNEMQLEGAADHVESEKANLDELIQEEMVDAELGRIESTVIGGISVLSLAVGSLFWALRVKSKRTARKVTSQVEQLSVENKKNLEHAVPTLATTKTPFDLIEKYSRAPSVELLSEFAVGEMSSLRNRGMKSRIFETEEISSHSVPFGRATTRKDYSVPVSMQPAISAISSTENRSMTNGEESSEVESSKKNKFTTPARTTSRVRSEDEGSEVLSMNTAETPTLRRSSRLRSRGIISP